MAGLKKWVVVKKTSAGHPRYVFLATSHGVHCSVHAGAAEVYATRAQAAAAAALLRQSYGVRLSVEQLASS